VSVNGEQVRSQGVCIDPDSAVVKVDGRSVAVESRHTFLFNKPRDVLCTCHDTHGRRTVLDFFPGTQARLYPVGRLDRDSEGLLIVTNDGALALALAHPRHQVSKTYHVRLDQPLSAGAMTRMRTGVESENQRLRAEDVTPLSRDEPEYRIVLREGRNRQIRRMVEALGGRVIRLRRVAIGDLTIKGLRVGEHRPLTDTERAALMRLAEPGPTRRPHDGPRQGNGIQERRT
jgi:23S rRNA pseudouridine2605 synthase